MDQSKGSWIGTSVIPTVLIIVLSDGTSLIGAEWGTRNLFVDPNVIIILKSDGSD